MLEIIPISTERMNNGAHFAYHTEVLARANADSKIKAKITTQLADYRVALYKEDSALVLSRKNIKSDEIARADSQRDSLYTGMKNTIRALENVSNPVVQQSALVLTQVFKDYKIETSMQLDRETGLLCNLIADLEGKYNREVTTLSLTGLLASLKAANETVRSTMSTRAYEMANKEIGAVRNARAAVDDCYRMVVKYINAYALIEGEADYQSFIDVTNTEIVRYKRQVLGQVATKPNPSKPDDEGGDGGDGGDNGGGEDNGGEGEPENPFE